MRFCIAFLTVLFLLSAVSAQPSNTTPDWIDRSNQNALQVLQTQARFAPEFMGQTGVEGVDDQVIDLKPNVRQRSRAAMTEIMNALKQKLAAEKDPRVRQDIEIMLKAIELRLRESELDEKYYFPFYDVGQTVFAGIRGLLDDQVAPSRRAAALIRLRKYAGVEPGSTPVTALAEQRTREKLADPKLLGPVKAELDNSLRTSEFYLSGLGDLFKKYGIAGYEEPLARLKQQMSAYNDFLRKEVAPRARTDFKLVPEIYQHSLSMVGIDIPAEELARRAHVAFTEIQQQMEALAPVVAKQHNLKATGYRDVIRELKKDQLVGDAILTHYKDRLAQLEGIINRERLVTLPSRPARIRIASPAESAALPAPNMRPPRMVGNKGEQGEFVLPLNNPTTGGDAKRFDDFTFSAASWTLTAHEARPGHEMQFATMTERGVSLPRAVFAFNSVNVEGWGLYAEYIMFPFMPPDGQLISLQHRLMRAARAFLDPELQSGKIQPSDAMRVLRDDVMLSDAMATQETDRYTFRMPGQAPSYFYGYTRLVDLRRDVEKAQGVSFNPKSFHDFVLDQGLLPPDLLRKAVMERFAAASAGK